MLVKCVDCGREISSVAVACPQCGRPAVVVPPAIGPSAKSLRDAELRQTIKKLVPLDSPASKLVNAVAIGIAGAGLLFWILRLGCGWDGRNSGVADGSFLANILIGVGVVAAVLARIVGTIENRRFKQK